MKKQDISRFSYFQAPISNVTPTAEIDVRQLYHFISSDERLRRVTAEVRSLQGDARAFREAKARRLPFVTPAGIFERRGEDGLLLPSLLGVVDVDHLASEQEAEHVRDLVFADERLAVELAFVSPSGRGVKFFVPFKVDYRRSFLDCFDESIHNVWSYLSVVYGIEVDRANVDVARCCFVSYDSCARIR